MAVEAITGYRGKSKTRDESNVVVIDPLAKGARESIRQQAAALRVLSERIDDSFDQAIRVLYRSTGHVIVSGLGKSGLIGRKIAATLASTGTPSFFVHSGEAFHGDLGMFTPDSTAILISYSGETREVIGLLPHLRARGIKTIALVGNIDSTLARDADVALDVSVDREICPNNLAPTSSTVTTIAMGDALAVALVKIRGFEAEDFARLHPGGSLGKRLARVQDEMATRDLVVLDGTEQLAECMLRLSQSPHRTAVVQDRRGTPIGLVSERELRKAIESGVKMTVAVSTVMQRRVPTTALDTQVGAALDRMERERLDSLVVIDDEGRAHGLFPARG